ncbi:hypothetical protein CLAFUW4_10311 [Fulvia fulva]|uniref:Uncharacterized protein n=1 Tax=Passalora fulva TaxID=5499 RepID=A0A9Q8LEB0_PASFU|nr:uncharacterized protein CLAFUR5_04924 [Fulvia fulva]KAK4616348.1 hypothetical protein CLAFUR4_10315 [Fulvia fulva]KAK4617291.1 hypothetical protein CLAFUR0_10313 [Fulvia fulva]UJO15836.1 hypothetical protein CLAFUR5_04924 [Fulvia fulva]WPV19528.1 hypothetical protein CLAFUW4_10311 [Fulvia fulva]WPV34031.1 hypothetical protein CLAFUW7_10311 [Fulvia fulva]
MPPITITLDIPKDLVKAIYANEVHAKSANSAFTEIISTNKQAIIDAVLTTYILMVDVVPGYPDPVLIPVTGETSVMEFFRSIKKAFYELAEEKEWRVPRGEQQIIWSGLQTACRCGVEACGCTLREVSPVLAKGFSELLAEF